MTLDRVLGGLWVLFIGLGLISILFSHGNLAVGFWCMSLVCACIAARLMC